MTKTNFPFEVDIEVTFRDLDAMGHVNNTVFFAYLEHARIKYMSKLFHLNGKNIENPANMPVILAKASCDYGSPAFYGEVLSVGIGVSRMGSKSFDFVYEIWTKDDDLGNGRLVATAHSVQVMFDYATNKTILIPDAMKQRIVVLQGNWQPPS